MLVVSSMVYHFCPLSQDVPYNIQSFVKIQYPAQNKRILFLCVLSHVVSLSPTATMVERKRKERKMKLKEKRNWFEQLYINVKACRITHITGVLCWMHRVLHVHSIITDLLHVVIFEMKWTRSKFLECMCARACSSADRMRLRWRMGRISFNISNILE